MKTLGLLWAVVTVVRATVVLDTVISGQRAAQSRTPLLLVRQTGGHWGRYMAPLNASVAPLCGNGRLDTAADYVAYWTAATSIPWLTSGMDATRFQVVSDEVCDDGNRLDGDGCAADCLDLDAQVCFELALGAPLVRLSV